MKKKKKEELAKKRREQRTKIRIREMGPRLSPRQKRLEEVFRAGHVCTGGERSEVEEGELKELDGEELVPRGPFARCYLESA